MKLCSWCVQEPPRAASAKLCRRCFILYKMPPEVVRGVIKTINNLIYKGIRS